MTRVSISEAARLTGKSRTTLHRLIKTGELSTCRGLTLNGTVSHVKDFLSDKSEYCGQ